MSLRAAHSRFDSQPHPDVPAPAPSPLCASLPTPIQLRVNAFLGFSVLMDLRVLSRNMRRRCETRALRWMRWHLSEEGLRLREAVRDERRTAAWRRVAPQFDCWRDNADMREGCEEHGTEPMDSCIEHPTVGDAVWLRRQLDRWDHCSRDATLCVISPTEAAEAYNWSECKTCGTLAPFHMSDTGMRWYRVVDIAQALFREHKHAAAIDAAIGPGERQRFLSDLPPDVLLHLGGEQLATKMAIARLTASGVSAPWLSQLSTDVLEHSVLCFLDFEQLMGARAASRAFQSAGERVACAWMNRTFPAGLQRRMDEQQGRVDTLPPQAAAGKKSRKKKQRERKAKAERNASDGGGLTAQHGASLVTVRPFALLVLVSIVVIAGAEQLMVDGAIRRQLCLRGVVRRVRLCGGAAAAAVGAAHGQHGDAMST